MKAPILIAGPTASGKSALALRLALRDGGCVINADALQVYAGWRLLTARPGESDEARVPHRLFGHVAMAEAYSVGDWLREVNEVLAECRELRLRPVFVGGTGLYFSALSEGLAKIPAISRALRAKADLIRHTEGAEGFVRRLRKSDPATLAKTDQANAMRLQRAWEVFTATGRGLSDWQADATAPLLPLTESVPVVLQAPPEWLNPKLEIRLDTMLAEGVLDECAAVLAAGWAPDVPSSKALGASEFIGFLQGITTSSESIEQTLIRTRQYAKRQRTWFRGRMQSWRKLNASDGVENLARQID